MVPTRVGYTPWRRLSNQGAARVVRLGSKAGGESLAGWTVLLDLKHWSSMAEMRDFWRQKLSPFRCKGCVVRPSILALVQNRGERESRAELGWLFGSVRLTVASVVCSLLIFLTGRHHRTKKRLKSPGSTQKSHSMNNVQGARWIKYFKFPTDCGGCEATQAKMEILDRISFHLKRNWVLHSVVLHSVFFQIKLSTAVLQRCSEFIYIV